jgi:hypothetical protein
MQLQKAEERTGDAPDAALSDDSRGHLGPKYSDECRRMRADRCAETQGYLIPHVEHSSGASIWPSGRIVGITGVAHACREAPKQGSGSHMPRVPPHAGAVFPAWQSRRADGADCRDGGPILASQPATAGFGLVGRELAEAWRVVAQSP